MVTLPFLRHRGVGLDCSFPAAETPGVGIPELRVPLPQAATGQGSQENSSRHAGRPTLGSGQKHGGAHQPGPSLQSRSAVSRDSHLILGATLA